MDRTTKLLLAAIALGLWANAGATWTGPVQAQTQGVEGYLAKIAFGIEALRRGGSNCANTKICD